MNWIKNVCSNALRFAIYNPQITTVRTRYYAEKIAKGPLIRRYGYKERLLQSGTLPHRDDGRKILMPEYR